MHNAKHPAGIRSRCRNRDRLVTQRMVVPGPTTCAGRAGLDWPAPSRSAAMSERHDHDHHGHDHHGHDHHHGHHHAPASFGTAFAVGATLNVALVAAQFGYGWLANSVALMADAANNLGDVL